LASLDNKHLTVCSNVSQTGVRRSPSSNRDAKVAGSVRAQRRKRGDGVAFLIRLANLSGSAWLQAIIPATPDILESW
jgi:hypothetical protein